MATANIEPSTNAHGMCLLCGAPLPPGHLRWCSERCKRDGYVKARAAGKARAASQTASTSKTCPVCQESISRRRTYCSAACRNVAYRARRRGESGEGAREVVLLLPPAVRDRVAAALRHATPVVVGRTGNTRYGSLGLGPARWGEIKAGPRLITLRELRLVASEFPAVIEALPPLPQRWSEDFDEHEPAIQATRAMG